MTNGSGQLVVVGQGAAGLAAALSAAETAAVAGQAVRITLVDKAPETEAGGNTRWSPSYTRMAAPDRVEPTFIEDMLAATQVKGDRRDFTRLAHEAPATSKWV
ncbi:MAG: FAD-binding protein, partial [Pseudolabrys sp.]